MVDAERIAYNAAAFICALFMLEFGADKFIDHTTIVARRTRIPPGVIALLTAGAEWEELAVVAVSIARHRSSLALGNIVGSTISNILAAFSLGLLFHRSGQGELFDQSSKIYSALLLALTTLIAALTAFTHIIYWRVAGVVAIVVFAVYIASIAWIISKGRITAPEPSDSEGSDDDDGDRSQSREDGWQRVPASERSGEQNAVGQEGQDSVANIKTTSTDALILFDDGESATAPASHNPNTMPSLEHVETDTSDTSARSHDHGLAYHVVLLLVGMLAIVLSAYVLSHAASTLVDASGISDVAFGVVILSLATTLPEKLIAVVSGFRGQMGIMVANTVGSNIFLLSLCVGVLWVSTDGNYDQGSVKPAEIGVMLISTVLLNLTVWFGSSWARWIGAGMMAAYVAFLTLEFTVIHNA